MKLMSTLAKLTLMMFIAITITGIIDLVFIGYSVSWTGFGNFTAPTGEFTRGKTLWDWMELLLVPLMLAGGAILFSRIEREDEQERAETRAIFERSITEDRQREDALQAYLDRMTDLLLKEDLRTAENAEVRNVARVKTLTVLPRLDGKRKAVILAFLKEALLIGSDKVVDLHGADLSRAVLEQADLSKTSLRETNLNGANLWRANLRATDLAYANISNANLSGARLDEAILRYATLRASDFSRACLIRVNLSRADLNGTNLFRADLTGADLHGADLTGANLNYANLCGANFYGADLRGADLSHSILNDANLTGAIMPDGLKHD